MPGDVPKKRFLIVGQHFWPESFRVNDIADYFVEQGMDVDVLCGLPNYPKGEFMDGYGYFRKRHENHNGIRIDRVLEIKRGKNSSLRIFLNYVSFPFFSIFHIPKLLFRRYDHVFLYQLSPVMMSFAGIVVAKLKRIPSTMYVLDLWPENLYSVLSIRNRFLRWVARAVSHWHYRRVDQLIALSETMKDKLFAITKNPRIAVIPQAAEKIYEQKASDPKLRKRFADTFNVVFTGNISPAQDPETMVAAAEILHRKGLKDIRWIIVGDGMSRKSMEQSVKNRGLASIFSFEGQKPIEDMPKYADVASVLLGCLVKSDLLEATIPAKIMSYIAMGKPIILAMDGEVQDLINHTIKCGHAGQTGDVITLAKNIESVYKASQKEKRAMGERAREYYAATLERNLLLQKLYSFMLSKNNL